MITQTAINSYGILKALITAPSALFCSETSEKSKREIYFLFSVGMILTFLKSFSYRMQKFNLWENNWGNEILSFLSIPQVKWFLAYLSYLLFLLLVKFICKKMLKKFNERDLFLFFLSISGVGIILQAVFYCIGFIIPAKIVYLLSYIGFLWIFYLSLLAIKKSQNISFKKAMIVYFVSALPIVILIGFPGVSPFLMWLTN